MIKLSRCVIALILVLVMATLVPLQALGDTPKYISEVKVGMGKTVDEAAAALKGYTIVKNGSDYANLNEDAGGGLAGSKGQKAVLLGYKTTSEADDAITDLAVVNMKGNYTVKDYNIFLKELMNTEIIPFIDSFIAALEEYRANYNSKYPENKARAQYFHDMLDTLTDDDTGMGLGELLLNETKYEMGDKAYDKLSAAEKKKHADIMTILLQANGKALVMMKRYIAFSSDSNEDNWLNRFSNLDYEKMENDLDMLPTDARRYMDKMYQDDAKKILAMWEDFRTQLLNCDDTMEVIENVDEEELEDIEKTLEESDVKSGDEEEIDKFIKASVQMENKAEILSSAVTFVTAKEVLENIDYGDGTMLDFFTQDYETVEKDISILYPLVASLTEGQRASLDFLNLPDMVRMTVLGSEGYGETDFEEIEPVSIYLGVDRSIYSKGNIGATDSTLLNQAADEMSEDILIQNIWSNIFTQRESEISKVVHAVMTYAVPMGTNGWKLISMGIAYNSYGLGIFQYSQFSGLSTVTLNAISTHVKEQIELAQMWGSDTIQTTIAEQNIIGRAWASATGFTKFLNCLSYALVLYQIYSIFSSWKEISDFYNVEFTPAPRYMMEKHRVMKLNSKGEYTWVKNVVANYDAVKCNRTKNDEMYSVLGDTADLNGDVGREWIALYATKSKELQPILANSFKIQTGKKAGNLPAGYETGIHRFGTPAALDLNTTAYSWTHGLDGICLYYKTDSAAPIAASTFSDGVIAIVAVCGFLTGAVFTLLIFKIKKKEENQAQAV